MFFVKISRDRASQSFQFALRTLLADTLTVFWGDWLDLRVRIPQVAASGLVSPLIYILAFGLGLGSSLDRVSTPTAGDTYLEFILPGMVALSSMVISFGGTTFSICGERLFSKTFEEMLLYPIHPLALHLGKMLAGIVRGLMTASAVILVAVLFTGKIWSFINPLFFLLVILNCAVFAGLGVIVGLNVKSLESVGLFNNFLIVPMSFLGGTFFDPGDAARCAEANCVSLAVDLYNNWTAGCGLQAFGSLSLVYHSHSVCLCCFAYLFGRVPVLESARLGQRG